MKKLFSLFFLSFCFLLFGSLSAMQNEQQEQLDRQLVEAAEAGNLKQVQELVRSGANVNARDEDDYDNTSLHWAAGLGDKSMVDFLLANKAAINTQNASGITPLHYAVIQGRLPIVRLLLSKGADISRQDINNETALDYARNYGFQMIAKLIQDYLRAQSIAQLQASPEPEFSIS